MAYLLDDRRQRPIILGADPELTEGAVAPAARPLDWRALAEGAVRAFVAVQVVEWQCRIEREAARQRRLAEEEEERYVLLHGHARVALGGRALAAAERNARHAVAARRGSLAPGVTLLWTETHRGPVRYGYTVACETFIGQRKAEWRADCDPYGTLLRLRRVVDRAPRAPERPVPVASAAPALPSGAEGDTSGRPGGWFRSIWGRSG